MNCFGHVTLVLRNPITGDVIPIMDKKNLIVNQAGDAMAAMAASSRFSIRYVYFQFRNGSITPSEPEVTDNIALFDGLQAPDDYLRVPLVTSPTIDVDPAEYGTYFANRLTWAATTAAAPRDENGDIVGQANGLQLIDGTSKFYAMGLVASSGEKSSDLLYARTLIQNGPATKVANYHFSTTWAIKFTPNS